ncbi:NAD(P)-dependent oxidoreductase [Rhodovulum visakhapatnamense]|uniref:NAD(P)-binding domain-containing protein n=1 Tax=Rhodovulum visakhapatnamense TaxID=364297 RepID=A0A4R8GCJ4_9RHOB|nr:NAD(P)-dependent oxidoreductase [Rhodovulum visakhapatnamense]TDX33612.1 hypothetical protein EV657_10140 [Rhodovulum visakhapatnamense]
MTNVALVGASGNAGSEILKELSARGHRVTAIARNPERIAALLGVTAEAADLHDRDRIVGLLSGHDAAISAVHFTATDLPALLAAVRVSGVKRYLVVGGAGSLEIAPGQRLIDTPDFPEAYKPEAARGADYLEMLRKADDLDWTFLSPPALFEQGARTGTFRLGKDRLLTGKDGSRISFADYAIAMVDELERPAHRRERFTVGY